MVLFFLVKPIQFGWLRSINLKISFHIEIIDKQFQSLYTSLRSVTEDIFFFSLFGPIFIMSKITACGIKTSFFYTYLQLI